jgi:hypothetical protein
MNVNVFFLAAAGDSILYGLKSLLRPSTLLVRAFFGWIGQRAHPPRE